MFNVNCPHCNLPTDSALHRFWNGCPPENVIMAAQARMRAVAEAVGVDSINQKMAAFLKWTPPSRFKN